MNIYLLKAEKIGSRIIRWGTKGTGSHMGVSFGNEAEPTFFDSYGFGLRKQSYKKFRKQYEIVGCVTFYASDEQEQAMRATFLELSYGTWYDYPAFFYFIWRAFLNRFFGIPYPVKNAWQHNGKMLCTEVMALATRVYYEQTGVKILATQTDLAMTTPSKLYTMLATNKIALKL